jgi:hypothetical protein
MEAECDAEAMLKAAAAKRWGLGVRIPTLDPSPKPVYLTLNLKP